MFGVVSDGRDRPIELRVAGTVAEVHPPNRRSCVSRTMNSGSVLWPEVTSREHKFGSGGNYPHGADLSVDIVQYPDVAGLFRCGYHEFVRGERKPDGPYPPGDHQSRAIEFRHLKRLRNRLSSRGIEADSPDIEEAARSGDEIDCLSIRRPARLIVPMLTISNAGPRTTRGRHYVER